MTARVAVVGFGYVGSCVGAVLASKRYSVVAVDRRQDLVDGINRGEVGIHEPGLGDMVRWTVADGHLRATTSMDAIAECDVVIVTVGTPLGDGAPDTSQVEAACADLAPLLRAGQLVMLKSTVPPFTTERVVAPILEAGSGLVAGEDFHLAFCPERLAEGRALHELQELPVVVGGIDRASTERAAAFWEDSLGLETIRVADAKTAELSKLADNWWIDLSIAMGNELALLCEQLGVDALEVIAAANSLPKGAHHVNILLPSVGVGGSCLTKDPWFVDHLAADHGVTLHLPATGRRVNDAMPGHTVDLIEAGLAEAGLALGDASVAVLGVAFKNNTGDTRFTPVGPVLERLEASGCDLRVHDPLVSPADFADLTDVEPVDDLATALEGAHCVAFLAGHDDFRRLELDDLVDLVAAGCVIADGRMYFSRAQIEAFEAAGFRFVGIGR